MNRFFLANRYALALATLTAATLFTPSARADRDIFIASDGAKVALGAASDEAPAEADVTTRVFARVLIPNSPPPINPDYGLDEPGVFALPSGDSEIPAGYSALPANQAVTYSKLPFTVGSGTTSLFYWDGAGAVSFVPAPVDVSLTIDPSPAMGSTASTGAFHIHPTYALEKNTGVPADGVYLISASIGVSTLANSDRFYSLFLTDQLVTDEADAEELSELLEEGGEPILFKGKDFSFFNTAAVYVQHNLVPEPTSATLLGVMVALAGVSVRRRTAARS